MSVLSQVRGKKLSSDDITRLAEQYEVSVAKIRAVNEVEANGRGFREDGAVTFLFEPHKFYQEIKNDDDKLNLAIKKGLAYPVQGTRPYPKGEKARWDQFMEAVAIDRNAAFRSASWGLGQIMGFNHKSCGYTSAELMVKAFAESEAKQLEGMMQFIKSNGLLDDMQRWPQDSAFASFARGYNGKNYAKQGYHIKLKKALAKWELREKSDAPIVANDGTLRVGSKGTRVLALQSELLQKGYFMVGKADMDFGRNTRDAVNAWKTDMGMIPDGEMDQDDLLQLANYPGREKNPERTEVTAAELKKESSIVKESDNSMKIGGSLVGTVIASTGLDSAGVLDKADELADKGMQAHGVIEKVQEIMGSLGISSVMKFISANSTLLLIIGGIVVVVVLWRIREKRIQMHRNAEVA